MAFKRLSIFIATTLLVTSWLLAGWPQIRNFPNQSLVLADTTTKTFTFDSSTEGWGFSSNNGTCGGAFTSGAGNPAGSLQTSGSKSGGGQTCNTYWQWSGTWEDLGVTSGHQVTAITGSYQYAVSLDDSNGTWGTGAFELRDSGGALRSTLVTAINGQTGQPSWTTRTGSQQSFAAESSNTQISLRVNTEVAFGGGNRSWDGQKDNLSVTITHAAPIPVFDQLAYRFFDNTDTTDVGSPLAAQNNTAELLAANDPFRLRKLINISNLNLAISGQNFKLQFAGKGAGTCDSPSGIPSTYTDVTGSTDIAYNDNSPANGSALTGNADDPDAGNTVINQTYVEANNFTNSQGAVNTGQDGMWDFALIDNGAPVNTAYCFRVVLSDGTPLDNNSVYPEVLTAPGPLEVGIVNSSGNTVASPFVDFSTVAASGSCQTSTAALGDNDQRIRVSNHSAVSSWSLSIAATGGSSANWSSGIESYDFNDPTDNGCSDGPDVDTLAGQLSIDPSAGTSTPDSGCSNTGISLGSASAFDEGITDSISLASASSSAETNCFWDFTDIDLSQTIPSFQPVGSYTIDITITVVAN